mmetsp:Transcript_24936/g.44349  ORF Transcript_24936/g.44349 Transcript_24936/m.44349 type:complete len:137 (-) Transcript_24936:811-1221(-)
MVGLGAATEVEAVLWTGQNVTPELTGLAGGEALHISPLCDRVTGCSAKEPRPENPPSSFCRSPTAATAPEKFGWFPAGCQGLTPATPCGCTGELCIMCGRMPPPRTDDEPLTRRNELDTDCTECWDVIRAGSPQFG